MAELEQTGSIDDALPQILILLERIRTDLDLALRGQELSRNVWEEIRSQITVIRQVIDYVLFVTPEQAKDKNDLYPFSVWIANQFDALGKLKPVEAEKEPELDQQIKPVFEDQDRSRLIQIAGLLSALSAKQQEFEGLLKKTPETRPVELPALQDLDLQIADLRQLIEKRTGRLRLYDNFFYGLVVLLLAVNVMMLVWLGYTLAALRADLLAG